jgi:membrane peptidoglycan carboxypeptidase
VTARRLLRLVGLVTALAVLCSSALVALVAVGDGAAQNAASATEMPLPPLTSRMQVGSTVYAADGTTVLAVLRGPQLRIPVPLNQISPTLVHAVLDTEDHGFYVHGAIDVASIVRAALHDASGGGLQGGSTIAQQLVKQLYLTPARTLSRKIKEVALAIRLEDKYSKSQILDTYLNTIYLGNGAYGIQAAAETYFNEPATKLDVAQSALLAGLIQDPNGYDPVLHPVAARARRAQVLARMVFYHDITEAQATAAGRSALPTLAPPAPPPAPTTGGGYYVQQVRNLLLGPESPFGTTYAERYNALFNGGLKIYTNLDPTMQAAAESAVAANTPANSGGFEEGLVSIDPATGHVQALVGGPGTARSQFDVMTQGRRQPGSGFKLFTLLAALQQGYSLADTIDSRAPCAVKFPGNDALVTHPINNDTGPGGGIITLTTATADSVNCAYIRLAHQVGLPNVIAMANSLGVSEVTQQDQYPSMVIGSIAVHPIEMAAAYAALADGGVYHQPTFIDRIVDPAGRVVYQPVDQGRRVVSTQIAAEADQAFRAVVQYGTGMAAAIPGRQVAGKTGTTDRNVDAWFNGFTPQIETTVWMGNPNAETPISINGAVVYGADYPTRTWQTFDVAALGGQPAVGFPTIDPALVPRPMYVTSPSLVADDVLDHNRG